MIEHRTDHPLTLEALKSRYLGALLKEIRDQRRFIVFTDKLLKQATQRFLVDMGYTIVEDRAIFRQSGYEFEIVDLKAYYNSPYPLFQLMQNLASHADIEKIREMDTDELNNRIFHHRV